MPAPAIRIMMDGRPYTIGSSTICRLTRSAIEAGDGLDSPLPVDFKQWLTVQVLPTSAGKLKDGCDIDKAQGVAARNDGFVVHRGNTYKLHKSVVGLALNKANKALKADGQAPDLDGDSKFDCIAGYLTPVSQFVPDLTFSNDGDVDSRPTLLTLLQAVPAASTDDPDYTSYPVDSDSE